MLPVSTQHFVDLRRDPVARFQNRLAAHHIHHHRFHGANGRGLTCLRRSAVKDHVGREREAEESKDRRHGRSGNLLGRQADAKDGQGLLHRLHASLGSITVGTRDLEDDGRPWAEAVERRIRNTLSVDIAERGQTVLH